MTTDKPTPRPEDKIELVPWDPSSEAHRARMYEQRVACTWDFDLVDEWAGKVLAGEKFMYWIVLTEHVPNRDAILQEFVTKCPKEKSPLADTATAVARTARTPTNRPFVPVGHLALDTYPDRDAKYGLPSSTVWIKSLYISWTMQSVGLGRATMCRAESLAAQPPLSATVVALDTITADFTLRDDTMAAFYDVRGLPRPREPVRTNEEWYLRQGYATFAHLDVAYRWTNPATNCLIDVPCIFMKKEVA